MKKYRIVDVSYSLYAPADMNDKELLEYLNERLYTGFEFYKPRCNEEWITLTDIFVDEIE